MSTRKLTYGATDEPTVKYSPSNVVPPNIYHISPNNMRPYEQSSNRKYETNLSDQMLAIKLISCNADSIVNKRYTMEPFITNLILSSHVNVGAKETPEWSA